MSRKSFKLRRIIFSALYIGLAIFAIVQAMLPGDTSATESDTFTSVASQAIFGEEVKKVDVLANTLSFSEFAALVRKFVGHFAFFAVMGAFGFFALFRTVRTKKVVIIDLSATFLIAALTEFIQLFVPMRAGAFADVVLDTQGAIAAVAALCAIISVRSRIKKGKRRPYLSYYVALPTVLFSILFIIFNADNTNAYFCAMIYFSVCAVSIATIAIAEHQ